MLSFEVRLRLEHDLRDKKKFKGKCAMLAGSLKEWNSTLEEEKNVLKRKVAVLESMDYTKEAELASLTDQTAKLTKDLSELGLSCDELSVKAYSLEAERDRLVG
nr:hypothetical protein [Tanacetum cinerariifolium]